MEKLSCFVLLVALSIVLLGNPIKSLLVVSLFTVVAEIHGWLWQQMREALPGIIRDVTCA